MDSKIQCVVFQKSVFTVLKATRWCSENGFKTSSIFETDCEIRIRQISPAYARSLGFSHYGFKNIENGVSLLLVLRDEVTSDALAEYAKINFEKDLNTFLL